MLDLVFLLDKNHPIKLSLFLMHSYDLLFLHRVLSPYFLSLPIVSLNPFTDGSVKLLPLCLVLRLAVFKSFFNKFF